MKDDIGPFGVSVEEQVWPRFCFFRGESASRDRWYRQDESYGPWVQIYGESTDTKVVTVLREL